MDKFKSFTGRVMPLPINDIDTDVIIPAQFLTSTDSSGYGEKLFSRIRETQAEFPMNQERFAGAEILVSGINFGCGSSREHAVWALAGAGFKVVIAKSFADIFSSNSAKNGLLLVQLEEDQVDRILRDSDSGDYQIAVDLERQSIKLPDNTELEFSYDPFRKHCLLNGLDDIDYILGKKEAISRFRLAQEDRRYYSTLPEDAFHE